MILVFDQDGAVFAALRELELGLPLWRVQDPSRLEKTGQIELAIVSTLSAVPWDLIDSAQRPFDTAVMTTRADDAEALEALSRGLIGYIDARAGEKRLREAVTACLNGEPAYDPHILGQWLRRQSSCARAHCNFGRLTERQREVLRLIAEGLADKEIAERLGIATATAQKHVTNILERLNVANRAAAAAAVCSIVISEPLRTLGSIRALRLAPAV